MYLNVLSDAGNSFENCRLWLLFKWNTTLYARISPLGSSGVSQIIRAVVRLTSGKDTLDGGPGAATENTALYQRFDLFSFVISILSRKVI